MVPLFYPLQRISVWFYAFSVQLIILTQVVLAQIPTYDDLSFSKGTFFGGTKNDSYLLHVAMDAEGNIYGTGFCTDIPVTANCYQSKCRGQYDVMVFKLDPTMSTLLWATYLGGSDIDGAGSIAVNAAGEVYVSGYTYSKNFPTTNPADAVYLNNGQVCIFSAKLSSDGGRLLYSRILGNGAPVQHQSQAASKAAFVSINARGEAYVLATTPSGAPYTITNNAFQRNPAGGFELALTRLDNNGSITYSTFIGGSGCDVARDACYAAGKIYLCGATNSVNFPRSVTRAPQSMDAFVTVVDDAATPRVRRSFVYGSSGNDAGSSLCFDAHARRLLLCGNAEYNNIGATTYLQASQTTGGFVAAIDTALTRISALTMLGNSVSPTSIAVRSNSVFYIAGYVMGSVPVSPNALQSTSRGDMDGLLLVLDSSASRVRYGSYIGGSGPDYSAAKVLLYESGCLMRIVFGITTHSPNFPSSSDSFQPLKANGTEDQGAMVLFSTMNDLKLQSTVNKCSRLCTFSVSAKCPPKEILWDFGDSSAIVVASSSVQHIYLRNGVYRVRAKLVYDKPDTVLVQRDVSFVASPGVDAGPDQDLCSLGARVQLRAQGATRYWWSPGKLFKDSTLPIQDVSPKASTTYYVHGIDSSGCESMDSVRVRIVSLSIQAPKDTSICKGQTARLTISTSASVRWLSAPGLSSVQGNTAFVTPVTDQTYSSIVSSGDCFDTIYVQVRVSPPPHITLPRLPALCAGEAVRIYASVYDRYAGDTIGLRYQWTPAQYFDKAQSPQPLLSMNQSGTIRLTVRSRDGCSITDSIRVTVQARAKLSAISDTTLCNGAALRLWVKGTSKVRWSPSTGLSDPNSTNPLCTVTRDMRYTVVSTTSTCTDTAHVLVRVGTKPLVTAIGDTTICSGDRVCLRIASPDSGVRYQWSPPTELEQSQGSVVYARPTVDRVYTVTATNVSGCFSSATVRVHIDNSLQVTAELDSLQCEGQPCTISIKGGVVKNVLYTWIPNDGTFDAINGVYHCTASSSKVYMLKAQRGRCSAYSMVQCKTKASPRVSFPADTVVCENSSLRLSIQSQEQGLKVRWSDGTPNNSLIQGASNLEVVRLKPLSASQIVHVDVERNGCLRSKDIHVVVQAPPLFRAPKDERICPGQSVLLEVDSPPATTVYWSPSSGLTSAFGSKVVAAPSRTTTYTVSVVDAQGCSSTRSVIVELKKPSEIQLAVKPIIDSSRNSADGFADLHTVLSIEAQADTILHTALRFDLEFEADAFEPLDSVNTETVNGKRLVHCAVLPQTLGTQTQRLLDIRGLLLLSKRASSVLRIQSAEADATLCPSIRTAPATLSLGSCFFDGRHVRYRKVMNARLQPNPVSSHAVMAIVDASGTVNASLYDLEGQCLRRWVLPSTSSTFETDLDLSGLASGRYVIELVDQAQSTRLSFMKE